LASADSQPLVKGDCGIIRERVQEGRRALLANLAGEPAKEVGGVAPAPMLRVRTDRADLDRSIEPELVIPLPKQWF
jgi:hypothetical protein